MLTERGVFPQRLQDFDVLGVYFVIVKSIENQYHSIVIDYRQNKPIIYDPLDYPFGIESMTQVYNAMEYLWLIVDSSYGDNFPL